MTRNSSPVIITVFLACLMLSPVSSVFGSSVWKQTTDTDFSKGTSIGPVIDGTGDGASLVLQFDHEGLMGEWHFEEPSSNSVIDSSGNGRNGTVQNAVRTTGRFGNALDFNGASSYVDLPDDLWSENITIEAWVLIRDFGSSDPNYSGKGIFFKAQDTGYARDFTLMAVNENNVKGVNFWFGNGATEYISLYYNGLTANTWYHMAVTRGNGYAKIYINGAEAAKKPYYFVPVDHHQDLRLGTSVNSFQSFDGKIDEVRIYDQVLTATMIQGHYDTVADGNYFSEPKDLGQMAYFGNLHLNATTPANTSVQVQLRTANTLNDLLSSSFIGPDGTAGTHYSKDGQKIWYGHDGNEWVQYSVLMTSNWYDMTPKFNEIKIDYDFPQNVTLLSPNGGENWTGHHNITWKVSDPDGDTLSFDLYLSSDGGVTYPTPLTTGLHTQIRSFDWDTSSFPNGTHYRIRIVSLDTSPGFSLKVTDVSNANFTIYHPGPVPPPPKNHPPVVQTPPNGVVTYGDVYNQSINATDQDGDPLTFEFSGPGNITKPLPNMMSWGTSPFSVGNYTMTATVSDGKDKVSVTWKVEIKKRIIIPPPPNSLPKVTLLYPDNGTLLTTTSVRLEWNGTDADGDSLTYHVNLDSLNGRTTVSRQTQTEYMATGLVYNTTYYWTVIPNDGKANGTSQFGIWSFRTPEPPAPQRPTCMIIFPKGGPPYSRAITVTGIAAAGGPPLVQVEVMIDVGNNWTVAKGTDSWKYTLNTRALSNGVHQIRARSYDGLAYSNVSTVDINVQNIKPVPPDTHTTIEGPTCLMLLGMIAVVIVAVAYVSYYISRRRR